MCDQQPPTKPDRSPPSPRIQSAYKYDWQFDEALRRPVERIRFRNSLQGFKRMAIPITMLVVCFMVLNFGMTGTWYDSLVEGLPWLWPWVGQPLFFVGFVVCVSYAQRHSDAEEVTRQFIQNLSCFGCRCSLKNLPVDEQHRGRCPECGRDYSLGEYVHPKTPEKYPLPLDATAPNEPAPPDTDI